MRVWFIVTGLVLAAPCIAKEAAPAAGRSVTEPLGASNFLQMFLGLAVVIGVIFVMAWLIRRMGHVQTRVSGALKILGGLSLGQRERVVLVQVGENQILLGVAPGQIRTLHVLENPIEADTSRPTGGEPGSFAERLQGVLRGKIK
jgi:flagellar protein FliO/FliZ